MQPDALAAIQPDNEFRENNRQLSDLLYQGQSWSGRERNCFFLNTGGPRFANISAEYEYKTEMLAERLMRLKSLRLEVKELTPNRIRLNVAKPKKPPAGSGVGP